MRQFTTLRALSLLLLCAIAKAESPSSVQGIVSIDLYRDYLIVVRGSIGSLEKRNFIIDTGAYPSVISPAIAKKLRLSGYAEEVRTVGHNTHSKVVSLPSLGVGPLQVTNLRVLVKDLALFEQNLGLRIDGLIGLDVLGRGSFRIDYREKKLILGAVDVLPFALPIHWRDGKACIEIDVNGQPTPLLLDSGASEIMLFAQKFKPGTEQYAVSSKFSNLGGQFSLRQITLKSLSAAGSELGYREVFLSDTQNMASFPFTGLMAVSATRFRQVQFDFVHQIFSWEPAKWKRRTMPVAEAAIPLPSFPAVAASSNDSQPVQPLEECTTPVIGFSSCPPTIGQPGRISTPR